MPTNTSLRETGSARAASSCVTGVRRSVRTAALAASRSSASSLGLELTKTRSLRSSTDAPESAATGMSRQVLRTRAMLEHDRGLHGELGGVELRDRVEGLLGCEEEVDPFLREAREALDEVANRLHLERELDIVLPELGDDQVARSGQRLLDGHPHGRTVGELEPHDCLAGLRGLRRGRAVDHERVRQGRLELGAVDGEAD